MKATLFVIVLTLFTACRTDKAGNTGGSASLAVGTDQPAIDAVLTQALRTEGRSGSLAYRGQCDPSVGIRDTFSVTTARDRNSNMATVETIVGSNPSLQVARAPDGFVRITGVDMATDFMNLNIHHVAFRGESEPNDALVDILDTAEVKAYTEAHHIRLIPSYGTIRASEGLHSSRLSGERNDVTLSQALDQVLRTFPGLWTYKECVQPNGERLVSVSFRSF
jgi:hypothetical protein